MIYEVPAGHVLTITGPCRCEVVDTEATFTITPAPKMPIPEPPLQRETEPVSTTKQ